MRAAVSAFVALVLSVAFANPLDRRASLPILVGNDDGWAEANVRAFYQQLQGAGYKAIVSSPAYDKSGTGSSSTTPTPLTSPGEYNSIPAGSPAVGYYANDDHLWYVNAYPADGITYALANLTSKYLGTPPALVLTGPNVGPNVGLSTLFSGTVGAASAAGLPAIAFSAITGAHRSYTELVKGDTSYIYADGTVRLTSALVAASVPYLPAGYALNVNFPAAGLGTACTSGASFQFVLSRVHSVLGLPVDVKTCGSSSLPTETSVIGAAGCYASVSVFKTSTKLDAGKTEQAAVLAKLQPILACLP